MSGPSCRLHLPLALALFSVLFTQACGGRKNENGGGTTPPTGVTTVTGKLLFEGRYPSVTGGQIKLGAAETLPATGLEAYVIDGGGNIKGSTRILDDNGNFTVTLNKALVPGSDKLVFPALYSVKQGGQERILLAVLEPTSGGAPKKNLKLDIWMWTATLSSGKAGTLTIKEASGSGAVFIFLLNLAAMAEAADAAGAAQIKPLAVLWAPNITWSCGACYASAAPQQTTSGTQLSQSIFIGDDKGGAGAWGYPVLMHEFGHYVASNYSRDDSPGGSHYIGQLIAPAFAWSEGWASFFALAIMSTWVEEAISIFWDIQSNSSFWIDIGDATTSKGTLKKPTASGGMAQNLDEYYVSSMIWHLWDGKEVPEPAGDKDGVALGSDSVLQAIMSKRFLNWDRGGKGSDFVDFVDAVLCSQGSLKAQATNTIKTYLGFPYDGKPGCP